LEVGPAQVIKEASGGANSSHHSQSNGYRSRAFKTELGHLAAAIGLIITVCHMPPGTSKSNKIAHRLFRFISMNWRGKPLTTYRTVIELIAGTTTQTGLTVQADFGPGLLPDRGQSQRRRAGRSSDQAARLPPRLELHDPPGASIRLK